MGRGAFAASVLGFVIASRHPSPAVGLTPPHPSLPLHWPSMQMLATRRGREVFSKEDGGLRPPSSFGFLPLPVRAIVFPVLRNGEGVRGWGRSPTRGPHRLAAGAADARAAITSIPPSTDAPAGHPVLRADFGQ